MDTSSNNNDGCSDGVESMETEESHDEDLALGSSNVKDTKFDITIGHVEDIIMEDEFQKLQQDFLEKYYHEFEDTEENKFVYTDIHTEYVNLIEKYLDKNLVERMPDFMMTEFSKELIWDLVNQELTGFLKMFFGDNCASVVVKVVPKKKAETYLSRKDELEGEIFEMLLTFSDFLTFKEMFIDYRAQKEGRVVDLSDGLTVTAVSDLSLDGAGLSLSGQSFPR